MHMLHITFFIVHATYKFFIVMLHIFFIVHATYNFVSMNMQHIFFHCSCYIQLFSLNMLHIIFSLKMLHITRGAARSPATVPCAKVEDPRLEV